MRLRGLRGLKSGGDKPLPCLAGDKKRAFYVLKEGTYFLGREGEWGEYLEDFGCVSRRHLVLMVDKKQVRCRVLPTTNGTCFAKQGQSSMQRLPADTVITLQPGDCLGLGGDNRQDPNIAFLSYEII